MVVLVLFNKYFDNLMASQLLIQSLKHNLSASNHNISFNDFYSNCSKFIPFLGLFDNYISFEDILASQIALYHV